MKKLSVSLAIILASSAALQAGQVSTGPVSTLYAISAAGIQTGYIIQGNSATSFALSSDQSAVAVGTSVRAMGAPFGAGGSEYSLSGTPTGTAYANLGSNHWFYDGASDGTYNYAADYHDGKVYRTDLNWADPTLLFETSYGFGQILGITYDSQNSSLWVGALGDSRITDYSLDGTVISSFVTETQILALAYDPADGTLWGNSDPNKLFQYSRSGILLSSPTYASITNPGNSIRGMEFAAGNSAAAPEPATAGLAAAVLFLCALGAKLRHRSSLAPLDSRD